MNNEFTPTYNRRSMRTLFIIAIIAVVLAGCSPTEKISVRPNEHMEVGWTPRSIFQSPSYAAWFDTTYAAYQPQKEYVDRLRQMKDSVDLLVVFGTWCSDSKREMPRFFKLMDALDFASGRVTLVAVDRTMKVPAGVAKQYNITSVPTIIVRYRGLEIGRIVESPKATLEQDLVELLSPVFQ